MTHHPKPIKETPCLLFLVECWRGLRKGETRSMVVCAPSAAAARATAQLQRDHNQILDQVNVPTWETPELSTVICIGKADLSVVRPRTIIIETKET